MENLSGLKKEIETIIAKYEAKISEPKNQEDYQKGYHAAQRRYRNEINNLKQKQKEQICHYSETYPLNVIQYLMEGFDDNEKSNFDFSAQSIRKVMNDVLTERELIVLRLRFERKMTLEEIGRKINANRERVRQIEAKALRRLKHPINLEQMRVIYYSDYLEKLNELQLLKKEIELLKSPELTKNVKSLEIEQIEIEALDLSVRSYNCLVRAGIKTLGDIKCFVDQDGDFKKMRNLGNRSCKEILEKLQKYKEFIPNLEEAFKGID